jgi:hypothetical protein
LRLAEVQDVEPAVGAELHGKLVLGWQDKRLKGMALP